MLNGKHLPEGCQEDPRNNSSIDSLFCILQKVVRKTTFDLKKNQHFSFDSQDTSLSIPNYYTKTLDLTTSS